MFPKFEAKERSKNSKTLKHDLQKFSTIFWHQNQPLAAFSLGTGTTFSWSQIHFKIHTEEEGAQIVRHVSTVSTNEVQCCQTIVHYPRILGKS